jgi:hypothetical protein
MPNSDPIRVLWENDVDGSRFFSCGSRSLTLFASVMSG